MCSIAGYYNKNAAYDEYPDYHLPILRSMNQHQKHRGPDADGTVILNRCAMAHTRLSIIDLENGCQPMKKVIAGRTFYIAYNGEIYNTSELRNDLIRQGFTFDTTSDTEVLLTSFIHYGADYISHVNGIFAFAIYDVSEEALYIFRDHFGVKPLYYSYLPDGTLVFASEMKALFQYPAIKPVADKHSMQEIFGLGPSKTPGQGVLKDILEVKPGHYLKADRYGFHSFQYFRLESRPHPDDYKTTIEKTSFLLQDSIRRQTVSDVPICTFLSGGIDSSIVTSVCSRKLNEEGQTLNTFSFDFVDNSKYFKSNSFQPEQDRPYVDKMIEFLHTNHTYLTCEIEELYHMLFTSVISRDLPTMADVDSSLLYFCREVAKYNKVVLTGECADEVFGGYPWFYREDLLNSTTFPWMKDLTPRTALLKQDFAEFLDLPDYVEHLYNELISEINVLPDESEEEKSRRRIGYINIRMFMQTLLDRMDRTSMFSGLEARVPFADYRLIQYVYNIPWKYKYQDGVEKSLLRQASRGLVPDEVLFRKKSPYPKTYHPGYEQLLCKKMQEVLQEPSSPILEFLDTAKTEEFLKSPKDYGKPWYGQLMAGPQMIAYLLQVNYWLEKYQIKTEL